MPAEEPRYDNCGMCQYELSCFLPLRILHHYTGYPCKQGRKRKVLRQANIEEFKAEIT